MFTETQQSMIDLIAQRLRRGLVHPGDPANDVAPTPIALPFAHAPGRPKEMDDLLDATVKLLSEAIVHTIVNDGDCQIVSREELASLRIAAGDHPEGTHHVPVYCRCDTHRADPLAVLTVTDPDCIVIDGRALLRGLHGRAVACPHEAVDTEHG